MGCLLEAFKYIKPTNMHPLDVAGRYLLLFLHLQAVLLSLALIDLDNYEAPKETEKGVTAGRNRCWDRLRDWEPRLQNRMEFCCGCWWWRCCSILQSYTSSIYATSQIVSMEVRLSWCSFLMEGDKNGFVGEIGLFTWLTSAARIACLCFAIQRYKLVSKFASLAAWVLRCFEVWVRSWSLSAEGYLWFFSHCIFGWALLGKLTIMPQNKRLQVEKMKASMKWGSLDPEENRQVKPMEGSTPKAIWEKWYEVLKIPGYDTKP